MEVAASLCIDQMDAGSGRRVVPQGLAGIEAAVNHIAAAELHTVVVLHHTPAAHSVLRREFDIVEQSAKGTGA